MMEFGRLVTVHHLLDTSIEKWPTLQHYLGVVGVALKMDETVDGYNQYSVTFDPSPSLKEEKTVWIVDSRELAYVVMKVGSIAVFRVNPKSVPQLAVISQVFLPTDDIKYVRYSFILLKTLASYYELSEVFLRPYPVL